MSKTMRVEVSSAVFRWLRAGRIDFEYTGIESTLKKLGLLTDNCMA